MDQQHEDPLGDLEYPNRYWAQDKDRIVLLHEYILDQPPDGSYEWEHDVCWRAMLLWDGGREGSNMAGCCCWQDLADDEACGWRMLTSLPSCPNNHMRFPISENLMHDIVLNEGLDREGNPRVYTRQDILDMRDDSQAEHSLSHTTLSELVPDHCPRSLPLSRTTCMNHRDSLDDVLQRHGWCLSHARDPTHP